MLQGATLFTQKCHSALAPTSYRGLLRLRRNAITSPPSTGATIQSQQCRAQHAPTSFIWCRDHLAEMPLLKRTKGRAISQAQKCHATHALPNQFNGVIVKTQKCRDIVAPREGLRTARRNATRRTPFPNSHRGH